jgi:hypothetical protein
MRIISRQIVAAFFAVFYLIVGGIAYASDDPPTEFSKKVTAITGDWIAEDWKKGVLILHPQQYNDSADEFLRLYPEELSIGRTALDAARNHFEKYDLGDDTTDPTLVTMTGAEEMMPGVLYKQYRWVDGFDSAVSYFGLVTTTAGTYVPFRANCEKDRSDYPKKYPFEKCLRNLVYLVAHLQGTNAPIGGRLAMPQPVAPINVPGWEAQYLKDGTSVATTGSFNGLRKVLLYASPPRTISPDQLPAALKQFSDGIVHDDDDADKDPGSIRVVGTTDDPWIRREFPEAFEGPSIQMAGTVKAPDGKTVFVGIRCPNKGWLGTCSHGVEQAKLQIKSGQMEQRRRAYIAARQSPIPPNGIKTADVLGIYGTANFNGTSFVINGDLYLKDGTVYSDIGTAPQYIIAAESKAKDPKDWGRWRRGAAGKMLVTYGNETVTKEAGPEELFVGGTKATRLNGYYGRVASGGSMFGGGWVSRSSYEFFADGTFKNDRSSSFSVMGTGTGGDLTPTQIAAGGSSASSGKARYEIDGYMISFYYPDGQIEREAFAMYATDVNNPKRKYVLIGGSPYTLNNGED